MHDLTPESNLQETLQDALSRYRYHWWHIPDRSYAGDKCEACGHQNPPKGIKPGLPDLIAVGPREAQEVGLIMWEAKSESESPTPVQSDVLKLLAEVRRTDFRIIKPSGLDNVLALLQQWGK